MIQCRSLKRITFGQSSFWLCSVWLPLADAPASMAVINLQDGTAPRIGPPTGIKAQDTIGGIDSPQDKQRQWIVAL